MKQKPSEIVKGTAEVFVAYNEAKQKMAEEAFSFVERSNPICFIVFAIVTIFLWVLAVFFIEGLPQLYERSSIYPIIVVFMVYYFTFFLGSKFVVRVTVEEAEDNTSIFALFSACGRREKRSLISIVLAAMNTAALVFVLIAKDIDRI